MTCAIEIENLSFAYPDGHPALQDISLKINQGEKVALVGPNGAGKTTLLLHLNGTYQGKGIIKIGEMAVKKENLPFIRARVGLIFQSPDDQLFSPTVFEDVAYGPLYQGLSQKEVEDRVHEALTAVNMSEYRDRSSYHLSTGEKKRIAIATVLSMQPDILVFDEPTAGLDPRARRGLINLLKKIPQTILVATHDLHLVKELLPRSIVMDMGKIHADINTTDLLSNEILLYQFGLEA